MDNSSLNILIVDDTPANLHLLGELLEQADYKVRKVPSGQLALQSVQAELPHLILLDIKMSGMDGYTVCEHLKADEKTRNVPVIFISALHRVKNKLKGFQAGGVDYISKPFEAEEVLARVDAHIRGHVLQNELVLARREAERANRSKSAFLANMSHEIRTPMNAIINFTALCRQNDFPPRERDYMEKVSLSAHSLLSLINDILDFSKIEAGGMALDSTSFDTAKSIGKVVSCMQVLADAKGLEISTSIQEELPPVKGDPLRLEQILTNLLSNAIKFTDSGSVAVSVGIETVSDEKIGLLFSVRDTGIGMDEATMARIFKSFSQAHVSTARHYGGTGLGLAICKQLVELMEGAIWVESTPEKGSIFFFSVHFKPGSLVPERDGAGTRDTTPDGYDLDPIRHARILLVEDDSFNQLLAREILSREQFRVDTAENGKVALEMISETLYDCILMDVQMPVMDGYEATRIIREDERYRGRPIIAMTANAMQGDREKSLEAGMDDHLTKPIMPEVLFATLSQRIASPIGEN